MSELWYWRSNDRTRGPLVTEELEAIVLSQRLQDGDAVRLDGTEEWLPAEEIRRMFAGSTESPAQTAARLLETAATRRLKGGSTSQRRLPSIGGPARGLINLAGTIASRLLELAALCFRNCGTWLGRRGRFFLTACVATAAIGFLTWRFVPWGESDLARLQKLNGIWKQVQSQPVSVAAAVGPEVTQWLEATETDLQAKLREQPISGAKGIDRQRALARREMLFAVREIRRSPNLNDESRQRVDESLESAMNFLLQMPGPAKSTPPGGRPNGDGHSAVIVGIVVMDCLLVIAVVGWWLWGRSKRF